MSADVRLLAGGAAPAPSAAPPLTGDQRRRVEASLALVERCAASVAARYPRLVTRQELLAPGAIGLHEAARAYDHARHPDFAQYAFHHVRGRMLEAVRADNFSRRARVERAMERAFDRFSAHQRVEVDLFRMSEDEIQDATREGCDEALAAAALAGLLEARRMDPEEAAIAAEGRARAMADLDRAIDALPPREREAVHLVYLGDMTIDDAARVLAVHPSTVQRRLRGALGRLRRFLLERGTTTGRWPALEREPDP